MKLIIAGTRTYPVTPLAPLIIEDIRREFGLVGISQVVSGCAKGVDEMGEMWANAKGLYIQRFVAKWQEEGMAAGPRRNKRMAEYGDALLLIWDGKSKGSRNMRAIMKRLGKPVYEYIYDEKTYGPKSLIRPPETQDRGQSVHPDNGGTGSEPPPEP